MKSVILHTKYLFLLGILFLYSTNGYSQSLIDSLINELQNTPIIKPIDFVYLQTSKGIYEKGEDIWFKAYLLETQTYKISNKSQTLYLQMISEKDSVVWQEKYLIKNGITEGHLYINENVEEGRYFLKACTRYSCYDDTTESVDSRQVWVIKNIAHVENLFSKIGLNDSIRFNIYPEGGYIISGIPCRLAFKATNGHNLPVNVEGTLYVDSIPLTTFSSKHAGMGSFIALLHAGKHYYIKLSNGQHYTLPDILISGMTFQLLKQSEDYIDFLVLKNKNTREQTIYLVGQQYGSLGCTAQGILKDYLKIRIPIDNFPTQGIAKFTLYNSAMQPIAERLVYLNSKKKLYIRVKTDTTRYLTRQKGTIKISVKDENNIPLKGVNLGISIFDEAYKLPDVLTENILSYSYLSTQLKGNIYNPTYYFDERNEDRLEAMNLLLLTHGWRKYVWQNIFAYKGKPFLIDGISGRQIIKRKSKQKKIQGTNQLIQVSGAEGNSQFVWVDSTNTFLIDSETLETLGGGYIYLKPMLGDEFKPMLKIADSFSQLDSILRKKPYDDQFFELTSSQKSVMYNHPVTSKDSTILLQEVVITKKAHKPFRDKFMGRLDSLSQMYLGPWVCKHGYLENYKEGYSHLVGSSTSPVQCAQAENDTLNVRRRPVIGKSYAIIKYEPQADGIWILTDEQNITYEGALYSDEELLRMNNLWRVKGYYATREFYQPDEIDIQSSIPDSRNTLLWIPSVITNEKGEATISFYCSDINTGFIGLIEGVDGKGLLGTAQCKLRVMKY